jgi:hypothetical protein
MRGIDFKFHPGTHNPNIRPVNLFDKGIMRGNPTPECGDSPPEVPVYLCQRKEVQGQSRVQYVPLSVLRFLSLKPPLYRGQRLFVCLRDRLVILDSQILTLTEYRLLALLVEHAGEVVPRPVLLKLIGQLACFISRSQSGSGVHLRPPSNLKVGRNNLRFALYGLEESERRRHP